MTEHSESGKADAPRTAAQDAAAAHAATAGRASPPKPAGVARQALVYGVGEVLSKAVSFIMLPLYTSYLTPADYGVVSLVYMTFNLVSIVAGARLTAGIFRFYHKSDTERERNTVISTAMLLITVAYAVLSLLGFLFAAPLSNAIFSTPVHADVLRLAAISFLFQGIIAVPFAYLTVSEQPKLFVSVNLAKLVLQATLNYVFLAQMHWGVRSVFTSSVIADALFLLLLGWRQLRETGIGFSSDEAARLVRFWWPLIFTQGALFVLTYGDRFFLQREGGETVVGLYALAYNFGFLLVQIGFSPFARVWDSVRFRVAKQREADRDAPFSQAFIDVNVLLLTFGTGIMLFVRDFLRVMSKPAFHSAADIVPVILVAYLLQCWAMMQEVGVMVTERTGWNTVANVAGAVVALAGYILLIPRYLGFGAAWATLISFAVRWIVLYIASQRLWPIRYRWAPVAKLVVYSGAVSWIGFALPARIPVVTSIAAHSALFLGYLAGLWYLGVVADSYREKARGVVQGLVERTRR